LIQIPRTAKQDIDVAAIFERNRRSYTYALQYTFVRRYMVLFASNFLLFDFLNMMN